jgi:hypothetical protein
VNELNKVIILNDFLLKLIQNDEEVYLTLPIDFEAMKFDRTKKSNLLKFSITKAQILPYCTQHRLIHKIIVIDLIFNLELI